MHPPWSDGSGIEHSQTAIAADEGHVRVAARARVPEELALRRLDARRRRLEENKRRQCAACPRAGLDEEAEVAA